MPPIIEIKNLGKQYHIGEQPPYLSIRDTITQTAKNIFHSKKKDDSFWGLRDINLEINQGERIGIIGRNGAGKSTLLKILSKITPPTTGSVKLRGRVASLLEVGTGFHPELTGRENIFLNGAILGLSKKEIQQRLDQIIDFSGIEKFIDTPLKHYSSGMQLRLAFSVAAHLEPEILLIDEVLAVGDIEFQKKCMGKMEEVSKSEGRTILFVSHNMSYISGLCNKAILLDKGHLIKTGATSSIINEYINNIATTSLLDKQHKRSADDEIVKLTHIRLIDPSGHTKESFSTGEKFGIEMEYQVLQNEHVLWLGYNIHNTDGVNIFDTHSVNTSMYNKPHEKGTYKGVAWIPEHLLNTGLYFVSCAIFNHLKPVIHFHEKDLLVFNIYDDTDQVSSRGMSPGDFPGIVRPLLEWQIEKKF
jgi:lipopolysaccharide transport system ATP-binding protein